MAEPGRWVGSLKPQLTISASRAGSVQEDRVGNISQRRVKGPKEVGEEQDFRKSKFGRKERTSFLRKGRGLKRGRDQ